MQIKKHQILNHDLTGASLVDSIGIYDETKNYSVGDIVIWNAQSYVCISNVSGVNEGDLSNAPDIATANWELNNPDVIFSCMNSTAQTFTGSRITIEFDTVDFNSSFATLNASNEVEINENITLIVSISLNSYITSGTDRSGCTAFLQIDTGSGYSDVSNFEINMYNRDRYTGRFTGSYVLPMKFGIGDKIRVQIYRYDGNSTLSTIANKCQIVLYNAKGGKGPKGADGDITWKGPWISQNYTENDAVEYNGSSYVCIQDTVSNENPTNTTYWDLMASKGDQGDTGPVGPSGDLNWTGPYSSTTTYNINDVVEYNGSSYVCLTNSTTGDDPPSANWDLIAQKGVDGAGSSIIIQDDGSSIPNTPHDTLNFTGNINVSDSGSGVAEINVPMPPVIVSYGMTTTQVVNNTIQTVPFNDVIKSDPAFSINSTTGRITVNRRLSAWISYNIFMTLDSGDNARNTITAWIRLNGSKLDYSQTAAYTRGYAYDKYANCSCPPTFVKLEAGDYLEVVYVRDDDIQSPVIGNSQTWILINEVL